VWRPFATDILGPLPYRLLADLTVVVHAGFVLFVVAGGLLVLRWPRAAWLHLPAAVWGVAIELGGWICPLTPLENELRRRGGEAGYGGGFVEHYLLPALYPASLTRDTQLVLGALVIALNAVIYGVVIARRRRRRGSVPRAENRNPLPMRSTVMTMANNEPRDLDVVGDVIRIHLDGAATGGSLAIVEEITPPGGGPPPHVHRNEDEAFYVLEGELEFLLGDRWTRVAPGASVFGPRGVPHTFRNVGAASSRVLAVLTPAGFERFFEEVDRLAAAGPPPPQQLIELGARYGLEFLPPV